MNRNILCLFFIILIIGFGSIICNFTITSIETYNPIYNTKKREIAPYFENTSENGTRHLRFDLSNRLSEENTLTFMTSHQEILILDNENVLYSVSEGESSLNKTPGTVWSFVNIPKETKSIDVYLRNIYPNIEGKIDEFFIGNGALIVKDIVRNSYMENTLCLMDILMGVLLIIFWIIYREKTFVRIDPLCLGIVAILIGLWSLNESNMAVLIIENRSASSYSGFVYLMLVITPFIQFTKSYYNLEDNNIGNIICGVSLINVVILILLYLTGMYGVKETVSSTHILMLFAVTYFVFALLMYFKREGVTRKLKINIVASIILIGSLIIDFTLYFKNILQAEFAGRLGLLIYIIMVGIETTYESIERLDEARTALIYKELALKDTLTGLFNRNAHIEWEKKNLGEKNVIIINFDLNDLKLCNDTFGHSVGDKYIIDASKIICKSFMDIGECYRIGGDEFCIVITDIVDKYDLDLRFNKLEALQREYNKNSKDINMQIAYGYARFDKDLDSDVNNTKARADKLMYLKKADMKDYDIR